jgi:DNA-binding response OmpR family regulator
VVKAIVEAQGGQVGVDERPGGGALFWFLLPRDGSRESPLRREQFQVIQAFDGEAAWLRWQQEQPDLLVLDVNLPKLDGFSLCRRIRAEADTPIILLTVRGEEDDIIQGLGLGADDYIVKPFSPRQLIARAQAVLRRAGKMVGPAQRQVGKLALDPARREVRIADGSPIALTPLEFRLLDYLMLHAGQIVAADTLLAHVWGAAGADRDMLRQLVRRLRAKIEPEPGQPIYIETIPSLGYGLKAA